ncbi:hypothetical protein [Pseudonocardia sp. KRD291]|uniref:hypothetical protein n=1 Tax=Pseudonocardia sp. KRD291 TaxID=2792007 RepID=UPI001C4A59D3|nr:hypothetical protein [Pseudonocardia sp. KRD291]MBW0102927.1 hypothetical protein [Pseudonocardia sp. KRD291]
MNTPPEDPNSSVPFTWEELADLRAGMLTAAEEERLRMLMDDNPDLAQHMLADLDAVEAEFPDPPHAHEPLEVPRHLAARWQSAIAREAERRALGYPADASSEPGTPEGGGADDHRAGPSGQERRGRLYS